MFYLLKVPRGESKVLRFYKKYYNSWKMAPIDKEGYDSLIFGGINGLIKFIDIDKNTSFLSHTEGFIGENIWDLNSHEDEYFIIYNQKNIYYIFCQIISLSYLFIILTFHLLLTLKKILIKIHHAK